MEMSFESTALADTIIDVPKARRNEDRRIGLSAFPAIGRTQSRSSEALENMLWTALALSAIWALVVSVGF